MPPKAKPRPKPKPKPKSKPKRKPANKAAGRDYKQEYKEYHGTAEAKAIRAKRNRDRYHLIKQGYLRKGDPRHVHHGPNGQIFLVDPCTHHKEHGGKCTTTKGSSKRKFKVTLKPRKRS